MKSRPGGNIHIQIGVVHAMKTPQQRLMVKDPMLSINDQIKAHNRENDVQCWTQPKPVKETPPMPFNQHGKSNGPGRNDDSHKHRIDKSDANIRRPAGAANHRVRTPWKNEFTASEQQQHAEVGAKPDRRFVVE
jgi:hypothetical protein